MKRLPVPPIAPVIVEKVREFVEAGNSREEVFAEMRRLGLFMTDSIKLTSRFYQLSPDDAKIAVHYSQTWADCRESNDALHETMYQAAKEIGFDQANPLQTHELAQSTR